ncbi:hypothetical protein SprV_0602194100 [Sparganum proliferum]
MHQPPTTMLPVVSPKPGRPSAGRPALVRNRPGLQLNTKLKVPLTVVSMTLLCGVETWTVYSSHARKSSHFHLGCLRRILRLRWQDRVPHMAVVERTGILRIHVMMRQLKLRWSGHLVRMNDARLPRRLFFGDVARGAHQSGGGGETTLRKHFKELTEATAYQPGDLEGPRPEQTDLEKRRLAQPSTKHIGSPPSKPKEKFVSLRQLWFATSPLNLTQYALPVNEHSARGSASSVVLGPNAPTARRLQLLSQRPPPLQPPRPPQQRPPSLPLLWIPVLHSHRPPEPPLSAASTAATTNTIISATPNVGRDAADAPPPPTSHDQPPAHSPPLPSLQRMWNRSQPVLTATAHSSHTSAWSVACEFSSLSLPSCECMCGVADWWVESQVKRLRLNLTYGTLTHVRCKPLNPRCV